jgi:hypothetical protein
MDNTTLLHENDIASLSKEKANRLLWLGRYAERAYITLHILRKYHDRMIDEDEHAYIAYCTKMGIENQYTSASDFMNRYLYDHENPDSLFSMLNYANDNAIVLREEITSETLSYIQMAICHLHNCASQSSDINELQLITDNLLAFWGSIDARVANPSLRCVLKAGKLIESIDLHIRFGYSFDKVYQFFSPLGELISKEKSIFDEETLKRLQEQMTKIRYKELATLQSINRLFRAE